MVKKTQSQHGIEPLKRDDLRHLLVELARERFRDQVVDTLEIEHLVDIATNYTLLLTDIYEPARIEQILSRRDPSARWLARLNLPDDAAQPEILARLRQVPDQIKTVADKCLYDVGVFRLDSYRGVSLKNLGVASYRMASEILEILAEDRRLRDFFRSNTLGNLAIEDEVVFLKQCAQRFTIHAELLKQLRLIDREGEADSREPRRGEAASPAAPAEAAPGPPTSALAPRPASPLERRPPVSGSMAARAGAPPTPGEASTGAAPLTGAQAERLGALERVRVFSALPLEPLRRRLKEIVIDQDEAVDTLCDEFSLYSTGTADPRRPSSYLFAGPTGVGKNYLVESLVRLLEEQWEEEVPMLLLEGPNYTYPSDINELRGAARGFIRSDEEGVLTEFHHRSSVAPFAVILVDEVEKSHAQLQRFFLSVMDRGTVTDNRGQTLRFSNTLLVFTSNLGYSDVQQQGEPIGYGGARAGRRYPRREIEREMKKTLSPEFINRLITVHFAPLSRASIARIFDLELEKIASQYRRIHDLALEVTPRAKEALIDLGYSDDYGARFLATTLQRHCNIEVSKKIRRDEEPGGRDVGAVLAYLREVRAGRRVWREAEAEARVQGQARARLPYRRLRIDHRDGDFVYESGKAAPHR